MKIFIIITCFVFHIATGSWLGDVFNGLTEPLEGSVEEESRNVWDSVKKSVKDGLKNFSKDHKDLIDNVKEEFKKGVDKIKQSGFEKLVNTDFDLLTKVEELGKKQWMEETQNVKDKLINKWNKLIQKINNGKENLKFDFVMSKFQKLHQKLKNLVPKDLYHQMVLKVQNIKKKWKNNPNILELNKHINDWSQPTFMKKATEFIESENIKSTFQEASESVNKKLEPVVDKIKPLVETMADKPKAEDEKKIERFVGEFFKKPHTVSGTGKWEKILGQFTQKEIEAFDANPSLGKNGGNITDFIEKALKSEEDAIIVHSVADDKDEWKKDDEYKNENEDKDENEDQDEDKGAGTKSFVDIFMGNNEDDDDYVEDDDDYDDTDEEVVSADKKNQDIRPSSTDINPLILTGNENWDIYKKTLKMKMDKKKVDDGKFTERLSDVTSSWMDLKNNLKQRMKNIEKKLNKF